VKRKAFFFSELSVRGVRRDVRFGGGVREFEGGEPKEEGDDVTIMY